jgi:hypothetical protein
MAHQTGEMLRCDECGAEIVFTKACTCPEKQPKAHSDICCNKEMRSIGVQSKEQSHSQQQKAAG